MNFWKKKLAAYLHDPPSKVLEIRTHRERAEAAFRQAGFIDSEIGEYCKDADHLAASEARLPFPNSQKSGLRCAFDGVRNAFRHSLSAERLPFHSEFRSSEEVFEIENATQPCLGEASLGLLETEAERWRARFFAHWRLWARNAAERDYRMACLPADTRIPDHSIWCHMQVVSAFAACHDEAEGPKPAFLRFHLGPVQDFIAAARSHRDLWSGSYLLSWLMAAGLKALTANIGPDAVIFPNLREQPLFDLQWRQDLWGKVCIGESDRSVWKCFGWSNTELLTPNLPNVFLALVPARTAAELARDVDRAIRAEWRSIAESVWQCCEEERLTHDEAGMSQAERRSRFDKQVARFLAVSWKITPWPDSLASVEALAQGFEDARRESPAFGKGSASPVQEAWSRVQAVIQMATVDMPRRHQDDRFYRDEGDQGPRRLNNLGIAWSVLTALNAWELDAVRQTRAFAGSRAGWTVGTFSNKDALTGREEAVAGGKVWRERAEATGMKYLFKDDAFLAAPSLIKRLWHRTYLARRPWDLQTGAKDFPMPDTREVAAHQRQERENLDSDRDASDSEGYFAVLAFDGDQIGRWMSGEKTPRFREVLADYGDGSTKVRQGALEYFERSDAPEDPPENRRPLAERFGSFLATQRPVSSGYHLQFSEALGNFALYCARDIVEAFNGHLIYAGGDDVLAVLPADTALRCAAALRAAFRGDKDLRHHLQQAPNSEVVRRFTVGTPGFVLREDSPSADRESRRHTDDSGRPLPRLVPGPRADASVGVAIAHFKAPLQDVVRAARDAERRAKRDATKGGLGRAAVAVTLMKRSGEIIEWGARWEGGLTLYHTLRSALEERKLSGKFCHRWIELLDAYLMERTGLMRRSSEGTTTEFSEVDVVIGRELEHVLFRQRGDRFPENPMERQALLADIRSALETYLGTLGEATVSGAERRLQSVIGLLQTCAFAHRTRSGQESKGSTVTSNVSKE